VTVNLSRPAENGQDSSPSLPDSREQDDAGARFNAPRYSLMDSIEKDMAGEPVFEPTDPDGGRWVMRTWSRVVDPQLEYDDLPGLAARLNLPDGWHYQPRTLDEPLRIDQQPGSRGVARRPDQQLFAGDRPDLTEFAAFRVDRGQFGSMLDVDR